MAKKETVITHVCAKDVEIATILEKVDTIGKDVKSMRDEVHKHLFGNGRPGVLERVSNNETELKSNKNLLRISLAIITVLLTALGVLATLF